MRAGAGNTGGQLLWTSAARIALTTQNGRIIRTAGFGNDLGGYSSFGDAYKESSAWFTAQTVRWQADFPDLKLYSVPIVCRDQPKGEETIAILGTDIHALRVDESCASEGGRLDWSFENTYWVDPESSLVWRSIQHVHPALDAIETEILRPPA